MQTIVLKHVQVFVVNYFEIFHIFFFLIEGWVGGVNCIQTVFGFLDFFLYLQGPLQGPILVGLLPALAAAKHWRRVPK